MPYPSSPDFPHEEAHGARIYELDGRARLFALWYPGPLPYAPDGAFLYAAVNGDMVGRWDWAETGDGLLSIMQAYRTATSPTYEPPERVAPGGEAPTIQPALEELVARAMEKARPGANILPFPRPHVFTLER